MSKVTECAGHDGLHSSDAETGFRRGFILHHGRKVRMNADVCKMVGAESVLPDGFRFLHEVAGESE